MHRDKIFFGTYYILYNVTINNVYVTVTKKTLVQPSHISQTVFNKY